MDNHRPPGDLTASVRHSGVQQAALGDAYLVFRQHVKDGRQASEIVVLLLVNQVYMDYFRHGIYRIGYAANIPNNQYME